METGCAEVSGRLADSIQINYQCLGKRSHIKLVGIQLCFPPPPPHAWPPAKGAEQNQCCLPFLAQTYSHSDTIKKRCIGRRAFKIQRCFPSIHHTIMGRTKPVAKTRGARCPLERHGSDEPMHAGQPYCNPIAELCRGTWGTTRFQHVPAWVRCSLRRRLLGHK